LSVDAGGKFAAGIVDTGGQFATVIKDTSVTVGKIFRVVALIPVVHLDLRISPRIFLEKNPLGRL
jgi:hypothetical protein